MLWPKRFTSRLWPILGAAVLFAGVYAAPAVADPATFTDPQPGDSTTIDTADVVILVDAYDPAGIQKPYVKVRVDGVHYRTPVVAYDYTIDPIWGDRLYDWTHASLSQAVTGLEDGAHTVRVELRNYSWKKSTYSWSFFVAEPPTIANPFPVPGARVSGVTTITAVAADNGELASADVLVNGTPVSSSFDPGTGLVSGFPTTLMPNAQNAIEVRVTDSVGATSALSWSVYALTYPEMPDNRDSGLPCEECHAAIDETGDHFIDACDTCHTEGWYTELGGVHPEVLIEGAWAVPTCEFCHASGTAGVPFHTAIAPDDHDSASDLISCNNCHVQAMLSEHYRWPDDDYESFTCDVCHASTDTRVVQAIAAGDTECDSCHGDGFGIHGDLSIPHAHLESGTITWAPTGASASCPQCHYTRVDAEHATTWVGTPGCMECHEGPIAEWTQPWDALCTSCHPTRHVSYAAAHTDTTSGCDICHGSAARDVRNHATCSNSGTAPNGGLSGCHISPSEPAWTAKCRTCHPNE